MATSDPPTAHSNHDHTGDRHSVPPHETRAEKLRHSALAHWGLPALLGLLVLAGGFNLASHWDRPIPGVSLGTSTTLAPTAVATVIEEGSAPVTGMSEASQEEDSYLPGSLPFDEYKARKALELRTRGLSCGKPGRVEMSVSFAPSGVSTHAAVAGSKTASVDVARCVSEHLEGVQIPAFRGAEERAVRVSVVVR